MSVQAGPDVRQIVRALDDADEALGAEQERYDEAVRLGEPPDETALTAAAEAALSRWRDLAEADPEAAENDVRDRAQGVADRRVLTRSRARKPTDMGNSELFAIVNRDELRHVPGSGWYGWDGQRWRRDDDGRAERCAKLTVRELWRQAHQISDAEARKAAYSWALRSEAAPLRRDGRACAQRRGSTRPRR